MSAQNIFDAQNNNGQVMAGNDDRQSQAGNLIQEILNAIRHVRAARRRRLVARRAGAVPGHLRRDLGFEPGIDMEIAVSARAPAYLVHAIACPLANHDLAPHDWPVGGANDNLSWQRKRSWLALA